MFLLVPADLDSPRQRAVKQFLLLFCCVRYCRDNSINIIGSFNDLETTFGSSDVL